DQGHQVGIQILPVGDLGTVQLLEQAALDLAGCVVSGRHDHVVPRLARQQLGLEGIVGVVDVVADLDAGGLLETGQGVGGSVFSPVVDVDDAILGGRRNRGDQRGGGQQGVNGADFHGMGPYHGGKQRDNA